MSLKQRLSWDEYWRLVMQLYSNHGATKSVPEKEMRMYYDEGFSPLKALEAINRKQLSNLSAPTGAQEKEES